MVLDDACYVIRVVPLSGMILHIILHDINDRVRYVFLVKCFVNVASDLIIGDTMSWRSVVHGVDRGCDAVCDERV